MNPTPAVATVLTNASALDANDESESYEQPYGDSEGGSGDATDTHDSLATQFDSDASLSGPALLELAQRAVSERDSLRGEVVRLREALTRSESNVRRGAGSSRELADLRDALDLREREVRRLKDANVARERLLVDARIKLDEAMAARQAALLRMEVRDRAASEAESQREHAQSDSAQWKKKFDAADHELTRALASERALTATLDEARLHLAEAERTVNALREELNETRSALAELDAAANAREDDHRREVASFEAAAAAREDDRRREVASFEAAASARDEEHRRQIAAFDARIERREIEHLAEIEELRATLAAEREGREAALWLRATERLEAERYQWASERRAMREELRAALDDADRMREEHALDLSAWRARNFEERESGEAALDGCKRGWAFRYAELSRELELERAARMCEATRQGQAMNSVREANEFAVSALRARLTREQERAKKAEDDALALAIVRDDAAVVIAQVVHTLEARIEKLEAERASLRVMFDECDATRESLAVQTVQSSRRAIEAREKCDALESELDQRTRQMAELVGALTRTTVEQHAIAGALKHGRPLPTMADVDAALVAVSRRVPEHMSAVLWSARETIAEAIFAAPEVSISEG